MDKPYTDKQLYDAIAELELINKIKLADAYSFSQESQVDFASYLLNNDILTDEIVGKVVAQILSLPFIRLEETSITEDTLKIVPEVVAKKQSVIAFRQDEKGLRLAMNNPSDTNIADFISKKTGIPVHIYYATRIDIENAFKYSKGTQDPELELIYSNDKVHVRVTDYGLGIPATDRARLFSSFHRGSNVHHISGTGLGLAVSKEFISLNGGTLYLDQDDVNTAFCIDLPLN